MLHPAAVNDAIIALHPGVAVSTPASYEMIESQPHMGALIRRDCGFLMQVGVQKPR